MDPRTYPFYLVAGISANNSLALHRPMSACGTCLEVGCFDGGDSHLPLPNIYDSTSADDDPSNRNSNNVSSVGVGVGSLAAAEIKSSSLSSRCASDQTIAVMVLDECVGADCGSTNLNLHAFAFE